MFKFNEVKITGLKASWIPANKNHDGYMATLQHFNIISFAKYTAGRMEIPFFSITSYIISN